MQPVDWTTFVALLSSVLYLLGAVYAGSQRKYRPQASRLAVLYALLSLAWAIEQILSRLGWLNFLRQDFLGRLPIYGLLVLAITFLFLSRALLGARKAGWGWLLLGLGWLIGVLAVDLSLSLSPTVLQLPGRITLSFATLTILLLIAGWAVYMGAATALTSLTLHSVSRYYTLVSYWALVLTLTVIGDGLFFASFQAIGNGLRLAGALLAIYTISVPRLPDGGHVLRRSLSYLVYAILAMVLYTICFSLAQTMLPSWSQLSPLALGLGLATILVLLLNPLLDLIQKQVHRWIAGEAQDASSMLRQYSQSITNTLDLNLLATLAVGTASEFLEVRRGFLFLVDYEKGENGRGMYNLRGVKGMGEENPAQGRLREGSPLAAYFCEEYKPLTQAEIDLHPHFHEITPEEQQWFSSLGTEVYVPIYAKNQWIGLLALGAKGSGQAYTSRDLNLLSTLADQTAIALENTRLVEGLMRLNNDFRRAYAAMEQANQRLERLDKTKSDFISIASHELRTPLTLISGASQMLLDDSEMLKNPYYKQLLSKMGAGIQRLHEIVDSLLDVAKIDTRGLELEPQPVSLRSLIQAVCDDLGRSASERKQTLEIQDLDSLPSVTADIQALHKVFHHLIINAIKYTPDGGAITISGRQVEPNNSNLPRGGVEIIVSDTGIGIDPRYIELIFSKFYQTGELALHSSGKTKFKGSGPGLGLVIARGIVEAHQGTIWAESPGHDEKKCPGSRFHVLLPLRQLDTLEPSPLPRNLAEEPARGLHS